jgi:hypothetical protein
VRALVASWRSSYVASVRPQGRAVGRGVEVTALWSKPVSASPVPATIVKVEFFVSGAQTASPFVTFSIEGRKFVYDVDNLKKTPFTDALLDRAASDKEHFAKKFVL